jgi:hypothetical protein
MHSGRLVRCWLSELCWPCWLGNLLILLWSLFLIFLLSRLLDESCHQRNIE